MNKSSRKVVFANQGLSLVELVVTVVLIGIIAGITARMLVTGASTYDSVSSRNEMLQSNRISMELLMKDLRAIKNKNAILSASATQLSFHNLNDEQISYIFSNGCLYRNSDMIAQGLSAFQFTYFNNAGIVLASPVAAPANIWEIEIAVNADIEGKPFNLESKLHPRNIQ